MTLKETIQEDMKSALRAKETGRLTTIRMLWAAIRQFEIDEQQPATDVTMYTVIKKMIKQRRDAAEQYQAAHRDELAAKELLEIDILQAYLPPQLSTAEIDQEINKTIATVNATSIKDMGKVMATLKISLEGRADMGEVGAKVKERLNAGG